MDLACRGEVLPGGDPVIGGGRFAGGDRAQVQAERRIDGSLGYRVAAQLTIFGVAPRSLIAPELFVACRPAVDAQARLRSAATNEVALVLVGDQTLEIGLVIDGVGAFGF